mmetsp:Transcript_37705/g.150340  ORF Transcript_37705/g.150340 Transcript_37705/m.150340 type:complete len:105 (-) Transcript_37705:1357-1671(-)
MVVSETVAAIVISVYGLRRSYKMALRGENLLRKFARRPVAYPESQSTWSRLFMRKIFKVGLNLALRVESIRSRIRRRPSLAAAKPESKDGGRGPVSEKSEEKPN